VPSASSEVVVNRPVDAVFAFLGNAENDARWRPGVIEIKRVAGEGAGTTYRQKVKGPGGRPLSADVEITEYRPNELIAFRATSGPVRPTGRYRLSPEGPGTRVGFELEAEVRGLKRLMAPMVQKTMDSEVAALSNLKRVLEEG
jgi:carbon monoxide dehydrogenase subunit G